MQFLEIELRAELTQSHNMAWRKALAQFGIMLKDALETTQVSQTGMAFKKILLNEFLVKKITTHYYGVIGLTFLQFFYVEISCMMHIIFFSLSKT